MMHPTASQAVQPIKSGQRVFVHGGAATPNSLLNALTHQAARLADVELVHLHTLGPARYADPEFAKSFRVTNLFVGQNMRSKLDLNRVDYLPCFLSEIPKLFRTGKLKLDVALVQVSPPDRHGYCTLGTSVDVTKAAVESAGIVIAQINPKMPRVHGDGFLHLSRINHWVEVDEPLPEMQPATITELERSIGKHTATLIEDGATLQIGIGSVPEAVLGALSQHRNLGVHTEMWSDGLLALIKCGAVNNSQKVKHPGKTVSGFVIGTRALYDFIHDNPSVVQMDIAYVNDSAVIAQNPKVTAINSAVEVDLTGQVCADSIGCRVISGVGGQMDFIRGASMSVGGKPIVAITSRTKTGAPRIVPTLNRGAGVVTTRGHVHYVVTEYGVADLYGKTLSQRAQALIRIAHPEDRESLERAWSTCWMDH